MPKKRDSINLWLAILFGILLVTACEYEFITPEKVVIPEFISFSDDILQIFNNNCNQSGCHVSGFGILDLSPANAYDDLFRKGLIDLETPELSDLYLKLSEPASTHQGRSNPADQATILEWIKKGAKNN